jgi:hypothetical protein
MVNDASAGQIEMFLVCVADGFGDDAREVIAERVAALGGVVFMGTGGGRIVVGMPPGMKEMLEAHPQIGFVGGVSFAEDAPGIKALQQRFALNAARQLAAQGRTSIGNPWERRAPDNRSGISWGSRLTDPRTLLASTGREPSPRQEGTTI